MSEIIAPVEFIAVLEETLERGQELTFVPSGNSMRPMLDGKNDKVTLSRKPDRLKKYDVALYLRGESGQLVMHRMVGLTKDGGYIFSGDGQYYYEYGIEDKDVLALMVSFTHKGRERSVGDLGYRLYVRRMMIKKKLMIFAYKVYHKLFKRQTQ